MDTDPRIIELEDKLKQAERRANELRKERDDAHALVTRMEEQVTDAEALIERFIEAFDMQLGDDGKWHTISPHLVERWSDLVDKYKDLLGRWNKLVPQWNATILKRPVGRPLAASDTQVATVRKLRAKGMSIRDIETETNLGMQTVRTIIDRDDWSDRATKRRLEKIDHKPVRDMMVSAKARKRTRDALPGMITETLAKGSELLKEAKGIK